MFFDPCFQSIDQREPSDEFPYTNDHVEDLATVYKAQGKFEEAEKVLLRVISSREADSGLNDPGTLISLGSLASLYRLTGREEEARALLETRSNTGL